MDWPRELWMGPGRCGWTSLWKSRARKSGSAARSSAWGNPRGNPCGNGAVQASHKPPHKFGKPEAPCPGWNHPLGPGRVLVLAQERPIKSCLGRDGSDPKSWTGLIPPVLFSLSQCGIQREHPKNSQVGFLPAPAAGRGGRGWRRVLFRILRNSILSLQHPAGMCLYLFCGFWESGELLETFRIN